MSDVVRCVYVATRDDVDVASDCLVCMKRCVGVRVWYPGVDAFGSCAT